MPKVNTNKRWVRILQKTENGFVEFEFFVADQDLFVELILPTAAFHDFCASNRVVIMERELQDAVPVTKNGGPLTVVQ